MNMQKLSPSSSVSWLTDAVNLVLKNPGVFLVMGLIMAAIGIVPLLGTLVMVICGPALLGGIVYAAREHSEGRPPEVAHLFRAFNEPGKIGPMLLLCLPSIAGGCVALILASVFGFGALISGGLASASQASSVALLGALGGALLLFIPIALAIGLVIYALQFFAIPRVMLEGAEPFSAMKESFNACLANISAYLVFVLIMGVAMLLCGILLLIPVLGHLLLSTALYAILGCALYFAWRQVYGSSVAGVIPPMPPEPPVSV